MRGWISAGFALVAVCACAGCPSPAPVDKRFEQAEYLLLEQRYVEARTLLKEFLLDNPTHSGAHYYLGRSYLGSEDFSLAIAEGEIVTGLDFFLQQDKHSAISRFPDGYFELICHVDITRIKCLQARVVIEKNLPPALARACITEAEEAVAHARAVSPDAGETAAAQAELEHTKALLAQYLHMPAVPSVPDAPEHPASSPSTMV